MARQRAWGGARRCSCHTGVAIYPSCAVSPVSPAPAPACLQPWNKWIVPGYVTSAWLLVNFAVPLRISRYGIKSANDCDHRDPKDWQLYGMPATEEEIAEAAESSSPLSPVPADGEETDGWTLLDSQSDESFDDRWQLKSYDVEEPVVVK